ncbi:ABC transporter ATP-binding protein [Rhodovibrio salinarum]|uniref:ABC transporter ATP-binding protein n=1 Tax=Rhodovibrio salinarum TaxID=1087 RepID=A0A934QIM3_9PROT|nr:ABC transporter ATP-binding protein [Rhodovibrio salinarum]MBK1697479.1 ABC transporter ATP-binding protein [Rhodovibrio salinarum]
MAQNFVLNVSDVNKNFGGLQALTNINLQVEEGKTHAVIGPNGAGKSTLLNTVIGRLVPDTGSVLFDGVTLTGKSPHQINQMGVARVFQTPEIFLDLTLLQNVEIAALAKRDGAFSFKPFRAMVSETAIREEAAQMLQDMGLHHLRDQMTGNLSRGDKRRLEIAMCLIQHPRLLLLDEPTAGMARHDTNRTIDLLKRIKEQGMTKVIIEHDMHVVFSLADWISVLAQGAIIAEGTPEEIKGNPKVQEAYLGGTA